MIQMACQKVAGQSHTDKSHYLLVCLFVLLANAISIRRRIASEREGLSFCCLAQFSIANRVPDGSRTVRTGSWPVAGRPRFFGVTVIDSLAISVLRKKVQRAEQELSLPPGPNPSHGGNPWLRLILFLAQVAN
jgi:hypothetical protein